MNKTDLIERIAAEANLSKADAGRAVDAMIATISGSLKAGESVAIAGFGAFEVRARAARMGRNPKTGESMEIAASKAPAFKPGKALKDAVN